MKLSRNDVAEVLVHLKRAGHDTLGKSHFAQEGEEPTFGDLVEDKPGCFWGQWLIPNGKWDDEEDEDAHREQCTECVCGYSALLNLFEPGKEEADRLARIEREIWVERAVANREYNMTQLGKWLIENDPDWAIA